jgi:dTDP-glucose 4,6-dehydratase/UDP-glucose 4-epimerase
MKVLILGSEGFIGKSISKFYKANSDYDIYSSDILPNHGVEKYVQINTTSPNFEEIISQEFSVIINCTGAAHVGNSLNKPLDDFFLNTVNVFRILDAIRIKSPSTHFINLSSAAVYGQPDDLPVKENSDIKPLSPYGFHKVMSESVLEEFFNIFNISSTSLRIFSCYGPGLKKQLFWDAYKKACNKNYEFWGTGKESRDFIYVDDLAKIIQHVINKNDKGFSIYNIASGEETSIESAIKKLYKSLEIGTSPSFSGKSDPGQPSRWQSDISALELPEEFSFTEMDVGLELYAKWLKNNEKDFNSLYL